MVRAIYVYCRFSVVSGGLVARFLLDVRVGNNRQRRQNSNVSASMRRSAYLLLLNIRSQLFAYLIKFKNQTSASDYRGVHSWGANSLSHERVTINVPLRLFRKLPGCSRACVSSPGVADVQFEEQVKRSQDTDLMVIVALMLGVVPQWELEFDCEVFLPMNNTTLLFQKREEHVLGVIRKYHLTPSSQGTPRFHSFAARSTHAADT